jgi:hypothetical protein
MQKPKGKPRGGSRKGRPNKSRDEVSALMDRLSKKRYDKSANDFVFGKLFELGEGVLMGKDEDSGMQVYVKEPNEKALSTLAAYRNGKPAQQIDLTSNGETLSLNVVYRDKK